MNKVEHYGWPPVIPITEDPEVVLVETAHELRNPIIAIKGYADLILNSFDGQEAAKEILKLSSNAEVVLNAVLDYLRERQSDEE